MDTGLEILTTIFTSERSSLKHFQGTNPIKTVSTQDSYGARMFDTFKNIASRAPIPPVASEMVQRVQQDMSLASVASFTVFQNIQRSAEALTATMASGSLPSKPATENNGKDSAFTELPALPGATIVTNSKEIPTGIAEKSVQLPVIKQNSEEELVVKQQNQQSPSVIKQLQSPTMSSSKPPLSSEAGQVSIPPTSYGNGKQAANADKLPALDKTKSLDKALNSGGVTVESKKERLPCINATATPTIALKPPGASHLAAKIVSEDLLHKNENIKNLLHHIYKSCSTSRNSNGAISSTDDSKKVLEHHNWTSPIEMLQALPRESMTDNLADKFSQQKLYTLASFSSGNLARANLSYSASDLPSLFGKASVGGITAVGKEVEPSATGSLSRRKSSSVGFLPMDTAAIPKITLDSTKGVAARASADAIPEETSIAEVV